MNWINVDLKFKVIDYNKLRKYLLDEFNLSQPICDLIFDSQEYKDLVNFISNSTFYNSGFTIESGLDILNKLIYDYLIKYNDSLIKEDVEFCHFEFYPKIRACKELKTFKEYIENLKEIELEYYFKDHNKYIETFNKHKSKFSFIGTEYCKPGYLINYEQNNKFYYYLIGTDSTNYRNKMSISSDALIIRAKQVIDMEELNLDKIFE